MGRQKHGWGKADVNGFTCPLIFGGKRTVIARLVRNCALGRAIQYSRDSSDRFESRGVLDAPPARGMTTWSRRDQIP
jgi:hypothetical protein